MRARFGWSLLVRVVVAAAIIAALWMLNTPDRRVEIMNAVPGWVRAAMFGVSVDGDVRLTMTDGKQLRATLYRPFFGRDQLATVLIRLPYGRDQYAEAVGGALFFARHGYAVLVQDLRGTGESEGEILPWRDAEADGRVTLDWIVSQPWSNGRVGTYGCSALGETQLVLSRSRHASLKAMIPSGAGGGVGAAAGRYSPFGLFEGGIFQLASGFGWFSKHGEKDRHAPPTARFDVKQHLTHLPISGLMRDVRKSPTAYDDFLSIPLSDPKWAEWGYLTDDDVPLAAALVINTWGDQTVGDALALAEQWRQKGVDQRVVIAPGDHCEHGYSGTNTRFGELPVSNAAFDWKDWYLRFFDQHLRGRGDGLSHEPAYTYFMLGDNQWRQSQTWPPAEARVERWYLDGEGRANTRAGDGRLREAYPLKKGVDRFVYDPRSPVPTRGGPVCCTGDAAVIAGPAEQSEVEGRDDVLVYTSEPLSRDLRIAGPLRASIRFSSSARDTDLIARLTDVWPDGRSISIQEGGLRLRYRNGYQRPVLLNPDEVVTAVVDMRSIAYKVPKGHRLRLQLTSSSFPRLERNLNTGAANNADESLIVVARNRIHHGPTELSWLELPVLTEAGVAPP